MKALYIIKCYINILVTIKQLQDGVWMTVNREDKIRYTNAVNYHYSNCITTSLETGYTGILNVPENATPAQAEAINRWNSDVSKK